MKGLEVFAIFAVLIISVFFHSKTIAFKEIFHPLVSWSVIVETGTLNFIFADVLLNHFLKLKENF